MGYRLVRSRDIGKKNQALRDALKRQKHGRRGTQKEELERQQLAAGRGPGSASPQHVTQSTDGGREREERREE